MEKKIRVLIVDDSQTAREFLGFLLGSDPGLEVVGFARNGEEAVAQVKRLAPQVITMDIHMPKLDGFEATREIMATVPTPIVVVSNSMQAQEVALTFQAVEAGAVAVLTRPPGVGHPDHEAAAAELVRTVKLMSEIRLVRRLARRAPTTGREEARPREDLPMSRKPSIVAIGASTGGPLALQQILKELPPKFPFPVLIVQHITAGFVTGFSQWLSGAVGHPVRLAVPGDFPGAGVCHVAPDHFHLGVDKDRRLLLSDLPPENGIRPSVGFLFRSLARHWSDGAVGIILTGMGADGADELKLMKDAGALTIAQDQESSVVFGMPGEAIRRDAATRVLSLRGIGETLASFACRHGLGGEKSREKPGCPEQRNRNRI